jgi:hypothetical protein
MHSLVVSKRPQQDSKLRTVPDAANPICRFVPLTRQPPSASKAEVILHMFRIMVHTWAVP